MNVRAKIDSHLLIRVEDIPTVAYDELCKRFTHSNQTWWKKKRMGLWLGDTPKEVKSWSREGMFLILPRGAVPKVQTVLSQYDRTLVITDRTTEHKPAGFDLTDELVLRPYQEHAVNQLARAGNGMIRGPCGAGKTVVLLGAIARLDQPSIVIVHSKALAQQWRTAISICLGFPPGKIEGGKRNIKPITVATQQTVWRMVERGDVDWTNEFGLLIGDEVHHWAARTFQTVANAFSAKYRLGASADERRKDGMEYMIYETFGEVVAKISRKEIVRTGKLLPSKMVVVPTNFEDELYLDSIHNEERPDWVGMISRLVSDKERNELILAHVLKILDNRSCIFEKKILILNDRVEVCKEWVARLRGLGIPTGLLIGGVDNKKELEDSISGLREGGLMVGVGTTVADEGLDIPPLTHVFITCPGHKNPKRMEQMIGRAARCDGGKQEAVCVYFWDKKMFPFVSKEDTEIDVEKKVKTYLRALERIVDRLEVVC